MAQSLIDLIQCYGHRDVEQVVDTLDAMFWKGYAEANIDVAVALLAQRTQKASCTASDRKRCTNEDSVCRPHATQKHNHH